MRKRDSFVDRKASVVEESFTIPIKSLDHSHVPPDAHATPKMDVLNPNI